MNYSSYENITSFVDMLTVSNTITDGILASGFIFVIWVVLFFSSVSYGRSKAIIYASFITFIVSLFMNVMTLVDFWVVALNLIGVAIGTGYLLFSKER